MPEIYPDQESQIKPSERIDPPGTSRPLTLQEHSIVTKNLDRADALPIKTPSKFHFHGSFDGTWNVRGNPDYSGSVGDTGVSVLGELIGRDNNPNVASIYASGVGSNGLISKYIASSLLPTGEVNNQALHVFQRLVEKANDWASKSPDNLDINITAMGFSRGCAAVIAFAELLNRNGIPDLSSEYTVEVPGHADGTWVEEVRYSRNLIPPGVKLSAIMADPVATGVLGLPRLPENIENLHADYALHEGRYFFGAMKFSNPKNPDPAVTESFWPGAHSTLMGAYERNGVSAAYLTHARRVLMSMGVPVPEIPTDYIFNPDAAMVHTTASGLQADPRVYERGMTPYWSKKFDCEKQTDNIEEQFNTSEQQGARPNENENTTENLAEDIQFADAGRGMQTDAGSITGYGWHADENVAPTIDFTDIKDPSVFEPAEENPVDLETQTINSTELPGNSPDVDAAHLGRTAQSAINAFNTFLSSVDNWGHMSDLQRVAALGNFYNGISVISGGSIPLPAPLVTGASLLNIATALESGNHASAL
ncbi:DUF2235 domain-containing protein, partial [bacterium BD-1]|nr:DUF2235 domain-containing protein [Ottowia caeni]